jgi:DNA repair protein SbcC/Rad50
MIPIHLTLQGIYSYQEKQSIDFTRLTEANIFGIFGSVGSGKSTILEAITYSLYGRTDRLNLSGDNRNYNMMNLKSNELLIEFIFKTGKDDTQYLATVKSRRNSKQFEDVKALDRAAYKKVNNQWQPMEVEALETIIGLSYENFKRTIIIPQGKFQEFLQLGNKERTQMMKELFNLDKYELYYKIVSLETKNNQQIQNLEGQLQQLGEINPDQIKEAEASLLVLKREIETKTRELTLRQEEENKLQKLKELVVKIQETEQNLSRLKSQEPAFIQLDKNIQEYEYCRLNFQNLFESAKEIANKINQFHQNIAKDNTSLAETARLLLELEKSFEQLKKDFEAREGLKLQVDEVSKIAKLHELDAAGKQLHERIVKGETVAQETSDKIARLKLSADTTTASLKELRDQYPDMALLSTVKDWYTVRKLLLTSQKEIDNELASAQKDLEEMRQQRSLLWNNEWVTDVPKTFPEGTVLLDEKKNQFKKLMEELNQEIEDLSIQSKLEEYATNLEDGKACPLCGALSHPQPLNAQHVSEALGKARSQKAKCEKDITAIELLQKKLSENDTRLSLKNESLANVLHKQAQHTVKIADHQKLFAWEAYQDESNVTAQFVQADQLQLQIKEQETSLEKQMRQLDEETQHKDKYNKALEEFRHQLTANQAESATIANQIKHFRIADFHDKTTREIETLKDLYLRQYREIESTYEATSLRINTLRKENDTIAGRLQANQKTLEQEIESQKAIDSRIADQLAKTEYPSVTAVEKVLSEPLEIEKEKKKVADFKQSLDFSEKQLATFRKDLGNQPYDAELHQTIKQTIQGLTNTLTRENQNLGKLQSELTKLIADLEAQKELRERSATLQARAEDIKTLKQLFKASGFVNYISSVYLHELCHAANERFYKLTRQKLSLEVTDDNNFEVRDFMNGGKVRNVKTLSGGQTFQAALSLALALADNIQKITESNQNFFFLDEGFGSLDKDSLDIVFDTLKSLRKENRIVGVISHVEEMQQEIDSHLKIVNDEEKGSLIKTSWS